MGFNISMGMEQKINFMLPSSNHIPEHSVYIPPAFLTVWAIYHNVAVTRRNFGLPLNLNIKFRDIAGSTHQRTLAFNQELFSFAGSTDGRHISLVEGQFVCDLDRPSQAAKDHFVDRLKRHRLLGAGIQGD
jgi:hypothetical protein